MIRIGEVDVLALIHRFTQIMAQINTDTIFSVKISEINP
jgi:hypothetical protein